MRSTNGAREEAPRGWIDREVGLGTAFAELRRMRRRALRRPWLTLGGALLLTTFVVVRVVKPKPVFSTEVILRITEGTIGPSPVPLPVTGLKGYISDVALSQDNLLPLIHKHKLYQRQLAKDPVDAVDSFR